MHPRPLGICGFPHLIRASRYLVTNAQTGDASRITYQKFASGLNEPLGLSVVDGEIYLLQKDQLSWLPDRNDDGLADSVVKAASGWVVQPGSNNLEFALGMVYKDSAFWGGLAINSRLDAKQSDERGCIIHNSDGTLAAASSPPAV